MLASSSELGEFFSIMPLDLDHLRRFAFRRQLPAQTTLARALRQMRFVQADPIRAPARAQDLTLRHRVSGYRAGDLERRYARLPIEEDFFVNYGFVTREVHALMHPRTPAAVWTAATKRRAARVLEYVQEQGTVHPRDVDAHFSHGKATNWFGGSSNVTTQLLDAMLYRGLLRVARREGGTRLYAARTPTDPASSVHAAMDAMVDLIVATYAPMTGAMLGALIRYLRNGAPQWGHERADALARAKARLPNATVDGDVWYWPVDEAPSLRRTTLPDAVRLLAPFDPFVWDRARFERFNGWAYRFEAYTPAARRIRGYYALPLAWREHVIGWANLSVRDGALVSETGYVTGAPPRDATFRRALDAELSSMSEFLSL